MITGRTFTRALALALAVALCACTPQISMARGGGHGGGGHHGGHHAHHAYHHSAHHARHHAEHHAANHHGEHHRDHYRHHHHSWHHGGWGPGFWGGAVAGYGLGYGVGGWGYDGNTYVDNSTNVAEGPDDDADTADSQDVATPEGSADGFAVDDWPELGVATYAGQYGGSQGLVVVRVVPGSAADEAGVVPGDVILTTNGEPTPSADAMEAVLDGAKGKFNLEVWDARTGRKSTLTGTLDAAAPDAAATTSVPAPRQ